MRKNGLRTYLVFRYLEKYSDDRHPLSAGDLIELLKKDGIACERKAIYADVEALRSTGQNIVNVLLPKRGYFLADRPFEIPEIRLLIDAVYSAGFITPGKTQRLVHKLEGLTSEYQAHRLDRQVYCAGKNNKGRNEEIYYVIDCLYEAIRMKKKVKFIYKRRNIDKEAKRCFSEKLFRVSPYALIWNEDHYYLVCNHEKYDNLMNLRLDRMRKVEILQQKARPVCEVSAYQKHFNTADYASKTFRMFSGETDTVRLQCKLELSEELLDRFGSSIPLQAVDDNHFETSFDAAISDGLVSWLMQYGDGIRVLEPPVLRAMLLQKTQAILHTYC